MDTELFRFRVDPELRSKAEIICSELGFDLHDVLRATVARIAVTGAIPFEMRQTGAGSTIPLPFQNYDDKLWSSVKPQVNAEVALAILTRFIADCSIRIDDESQKAVRDENLISQLVQQRNEARSRKRDLNVLDSAAVQLVLDTYGPLVRSAGG